VLTQAKERIDKLIASNFAAIAKELKGHDIFQFMRAVSPGFQEFIEALTFYEFLANDNAPSSWDHVQERLKYKEEDDEEYSLFLCPIEYILGYADLTGEVMRNCINSISAGDLDNCFKTCKFLQHIYAKFLTIGSVPNHGRDFSHKLSTMKMSTIKTEHVKYQLKTRGTEGAKFPSLDFSSINNTDDVDEGFY
jgi:predicted translin family RNA/ssDNA-binding protein